MRKWRWKRNISLLLILIFITSNLNVLAINIEQNTIREDTNINQESYKSSKIIIVDKYDGNHFNNIQDAINSAPVESTIYIRNGYFNEILNINKKINIIGESKDKTIINPTSKENSYAIKIASENIKISNLGIQNQGSGLYTTGIKISANRTTITSCDIFDTPVGIAIWSSENEISDCRFYGCSDEGIALLGSEINSVNNNIIKNCEFFNNCDGIELQYSSNNQISSCRFNNNSHAGIDAIVKSNNNNIIFDCNFKDNNAFGIFFSRSKNNIISKCILSGNKIMVTASKDIKLEQCEFDGIYLTDKSSMTFDNCSNFIKSKIKTVDSNYKVLNINDLKTSYSSLKEKRDSIFSRIYSLVSFFRLK